LRNIVYLLFIKRKWLAWDLTNFETRTMESKAWIADLFLFSHREPSSTRSHGDAYFVTQYFSIPFKMTNVTNGIRWTFLFPSIHPRDMAMDFAFLSYDHGHHQPELNVEKLLQHFLTSIKLELDLRRKLKDGYYCGGNECFQL
jgi:membrane-associated phospholipid phosphatase